jgi:hypothetical protein
MSTSLIAEHKRQFNIARRAHKTSTSTLHSYISNDVNLGKRIPKEESTEQGLCSLSDPTTFGSNISKVEEDMSVDLHALRSLYKGFLEDIAVFF